MTQRYALIAIRYTNRMHNAFVAFFPSNRGKITDVCKWQERKTKKQETGL